MTIRLVNDLVAPLAVVTVDLTSETVAPDWNEPLAYVVAGGGYLSALMGWGGDFAKNVGIASFPWAAKKIYERARGLGTVTQKSVQLKRPVSKVITRSYQPEFEQAAAY
ncbi:MAG TPA: hypothetical protein VMV84_01205 [Dehalococcoidales bacterium]|nr:hypothetical protein [Dehalococcoidales bacterium]